jgi:fibronectin-binding autotransporter adhesin
MLSLGGGIFNAGQLAVNNSFIGVDEDNNSMPNTAYSGGDIYNGFNPSGVELSLNNTVVANNVADGAPHSNSGGGIFNGNGATLNLNSGTLITGNTTTDNTSDTYEGSGGAGILNAGTININKADILSNAAETNGVGGGIYNYPAGIVTLNRGGISENTASDGGGVYNSGSLTVYKFGSITSNTPDDVDNAGTCVSYGDIGLVTGSCIP